MVFFFLFVAMNVLKRLTARPLILNSGYTSNSILFKRSIAATSACKHMSQNKTCWQCQATNKPTALFCENKVCSVIQPIPSELNFFHLLEAGKGDNK